MLSPSTSHPCFSLFKGLSVCFVTTNCFDLDCELSGGGRGREEVKCLCSLHHSEGGHCFSWELHRAAHALACCTSTTPSCSLQDSAAIQDSAFPVLWKPSPSFILIAQTLQRLLQQWLSQKAQVMHIDTHCVCEIHVPVSCSLQKNTGMGHYKSTKLFQCLD